MSPTIRSLMIPVSDLEAAKALYTALLGSPHTCSQMPTKSGRPAREVEDRRRGRRCPPGELPPVAAPYRPRWRSPTCRCS